MRGRVEGGGEAVWRGVWVLMTVLGGSCEIVGGAAAAIRVREMLMRVLMVACPAHVLVSCSFDGQWSNCV